MKILSASQVREWDQYTIAHEPVSSIDLMERASAACVNRITSLSGGSGMYRIFCGPGNNGGDGLAIGRMLHQLQVRVDIILVIPQGANHSPDFLTNLNRAREHGISIRELRPGADFPDLPAQCVVIDAIFGTGLHTPLAGWLAEVIEKINQFKGTVISIDLPSGLLADRSSVGSSVVQAMETLSFQCPKLAFMMAENESFTGRISILDIGLDPRFPEGAGCKRETIEAALVRSVLHPLKRFAHKGQRGHAALLAGSWGMLGAAMLAGQACLHSGAGKLTCFVPAQGYPILQASIPEAIFSIDKDPFHLTGFHPSQPFQSVGIGPGIGQMTSNLTLLQQVCRSGSPLVLDADALNTLALHPELWKEIPPLTILTPHVKEWERLFGPADSDFHRYEQTLERAARHRVIIVLKGHRSLVALPDGRHYFNTTGNPGMATAGSGDVLTGILTGLLAQGYAPEEAALAGVYVHGLSGDLAAASESEESLVASDLIRHLGKTFRAIKCT
jgi:NAD(P)H-hydrate epimerase